MTEPKRDERAWRDAIASLLESIAKAQWDLAAKLRTEGPR